MAGHPADGQDALAVRTSKKLRSDELHVTSFGPTRLRMELDRVPLWRGDHVPVKQLADDFARYLYLPRLAEPAVLLGAIRDGVSLLTWEQDAFAFADSFDEGEGRYRALRAGQGLALTDVDTPGLLVKPDVARRQLQAERAEPPAGAAPAGPTLGRGETTATGAVPGSTERPPAPQLKRFHGSVVLDPTRVGRDASRIADEVIAHLSSLVGAKVTVTLEITADIPSGAPDQVVRTVTENSRTLKFTSQGFETE